MQLQSDGFDKETKTLPGSRPAAFSLIYSNLNVPAAPTGGGY
jgi:hypothetical protein